MRLAILAHDRFPERAKTAIGVMRYGDQEPVAVVDQATAGSQVSDHVPDLPDVPIVPSVASLEPDTADALLIGVAPIGGAFPPDWREDVRTALERGWDVTAGLHDFLGADDEFAALAEETGATIWDVRRPPDDLTVSEGIADTVDATVVCTVGTDCSVGKMTVSMEVAAAAREAGIDTAVVPTGQTAMVIEGWGTAVDRVPSDFVAGAVEDMVVTAASEHELIVVEGQGSLVHPAYSGVTLGILHGSMPDSLVLCHEHERSRIHGYEAVPIPPLESVAALYEAVTAPVKPAAVAAGALNTAAASPTDARRAIDDAAATLSCPVADPVRNDVTPILEGVL